MGDKLPIATVIN